MLLASTTSLGDFLLNERVRRRVRAATKSRNVEERLKYSRLERRTSRRVFRSSVSFLSFGPRVSSHRPSLAKSCKILLETPRTYLQMIINLELGVINP